MKLEILKAIRLGLDNEWTTEQLKKALEVRMTLDLQKRIESDLREIRNSANVIVADNGEKYCSLLESAEQGLKDLPSQNEARSGVEAYSEKLDS